MVSPKTFKRARHTYLDAIAAIGAELPVDNYTFFTLSNSLCLAGGDAQATLIAQGDRGGLLPARGFCDSGLEHH